MPLCHLSATFSSPICHPACLHLQKLLMSPTGTLIPLPVHSQCFCSPCSWKFSTSGNLTKKHNTLSSSLCKTVWGSSSFWEVDIRARNNVSLSNPGIINRRKIKTDAQICCISDPLQHLNCHPYVTVLFIITLSVLGSVLCSCRIWKIICSHYPRP